MAAKIIRKEGKKLIIEVTVDLEDSMLDSEEAIEIEGKPWRSKGQEQKFYQTPYGETQCARQVYLHHGRGNLLPFGAIHAHHG